MYVHIVHSNSASNTSLTYIFQVRSSGSRQSSSYGGKADKRVEELLVRISDMESKNLELKNSLKEARSKIDNRSIRPSFFGPFSPRASSKINRLQAVVRGFMARARFERTKIHHAALNAGVLYAMKNTIQGRIF